MQHSALETAVVPSLCKVCGPRFAVLHDVSQVVCGEHDFQLTQRCVLHQ